MLAHREPRHAEPPHEPRHADARHEPRHTAGVRRGGVWRAVRSVLLGILAIAGILTLASVVASTVFGVGFGVVATGSMAPSIPARSLIVTAPTTAAEVRVGDIVSVPREGFTTTVTHRVVAITPVAGDSLARDLTLRGDDNPIDDPEPYRVVRVDRVIFSVPVVGGVIWNLRNPIALGVGTVLLTVLVLSAFWPSSQRPEQNASAHPLTERRAER